MFMVQAFPGIPKRARAPLAAGCRVAALVAAGLAASGGAAQTNPRLTQDQLDLIGRSSVVQGSGARAFGMGGAFLARPDDATAASWNPAGLSYLRRPEVSAVLARASLANTESDAVTRGLLLRDRRSGATFEFLAVTYPLAFARASGAMQVSYQRVVPFDGHRTIESEGRLVTIDADGGFDVLAVGSGLHVSPRLRLGATVNHWFNGYDHALERRTPVVNVRQSLAFSLSGWNVNVGAIWSPLDELNLAAVAKTPLTARVQMARARHDVIAATLVSNSHQSDDVRLDLPGAVGLGVSWRPLTTLTLSADYTRSFWSGARIHNFFTLRTCDVGLSCPPALAPGDTGDLYARPLPYPALTETQRDTEEWRLGVERVLFFQRAKVPLRAGFFSDRQYFAGPRSLGFTFGAGVAVGPTLLDVAYVRERYGSLSLEPSADPAARQVDVVSSRAYVSLIFRLP